jgi:GNAT superfamily N-acetyltransferase
MSSLVGRIAPIGVSWSGTAVAPAGLILPAAPGHHRQDPPTPAMITNPPLPSGYSRLPPGAIASVVTCLEMTERPRPKPSRPLASPLLLERWEKPDLAAYRSLYRAIGQDWLWFSRLVMPQDTLAAILVDPRVEVYALMERRRPIGLLELDFREDGQCELAFFGLVPAAIGQGAGRFLMDRAIEKAWARPIRRLWVHTCTHDHPSSVAFYVRSGFRPYEYLVEVADDPRLTGHLPEDAAPQIPLIRP